MSRRTALVLVLASMLAAASQGTLDAHAAFRISDPLDGATLGDTPTAMRLTFSERPDPALSAIRVVDTAGVAHQLGRPVPVPGDPLSLTIQVRPLDTGIYTVNFQVVSAVDGHTTTGAYAFGVRADPAGAVVIAPAAGVAVAMFDVIARWVLLAGLVVLLGAGAAGVGRFGGGREITLGAAGCALAIGGVALLGWSQTRNAAASFAALLLTSVGRLLFWRIAALAVAGAALIFARRQDLQRRRPAMAVVLAAALAATAVHVAGGHAAAADRWTTATIASQFVHFAAVGIWLGGLTALLLGLGGAPSAPKADVARRFSLIASIALVIVVATGVVRSAGELTGWSDLTSTAYGRALLAKIALTVAIAAFAAVNHWRSVAAAFADLRPLRMAGSGEVVLAAGTLAVAALLASLPPPAAALRDPSGLDVSGTDFGTTVRVKLTTPSDRPGPNRFVVDVSDYDSGRPLNPRRVSLRFTPLDDERTAPTTLELKRGDDEVFVGSGSNLAFDGRWRITVLIQKERDAVEVPIELAIRN